MARLKTSHQAVLLLSFITILWGFAFIPTTLLLKQGLSSELIMFVRFGLGAIAIAIFAFKELKKMTLLDFKVGILAGVFIFLAIYFQNIALLYTSVSNTAFISSISILIVPFFAYLINKKAITNVHLNGIIIAFVGIVFFSLNPKDLTAFNIGDVLALVSTLGFASQIVILEREPTTNAICVSFIQVCFVALVGLVVALVNQADFSLVTSVNAIPQLLFLGIIATGFCYVGQVWTAKHISSILNNSFTF